MEIPRYFSTRKHQRSTLDRQNSLKKLAVDTSPAVSRPSPANELLKEGEELKQKKDEVTETKKKDLLSRWAASGLRSQVKAAEGKDAPPKTLLQFKSDPKRNADLSRVLNSFSSDVAKLQKTPEKLHSSPFYAPHKESLTSEQATAKLRHNHLRRKLFSPAKTIDTEEAEAEASPSTSKQPTTPVSSPVKDSRHDRLKDAFEDVTRSPGKRVLLFSPSKGSVHSVIKTAAQLHSDSVREGLAATIGGDSKDAFAYRLAEINSSTKRKAEYDRSEIKRKIGKVAAVRAKVHLTELAQSSSTSEPLIPAYQRYAEDVKAKKLPLPSSFRDVYNLFERMDRNVATFHNRTETCYFEKLDDSLKPFLGRALSHNDLGQIKAVFPKAYVFNVEKPPSLLASPGVSHKSFGEEHLVIYVRDDVKDENDTLPEDNFRLRCPVNPADLVRRRHTLYSSLLNVVFQEHHKFLDATYPSAVVEDREIERWHPHFSIDDVPFPPVAELPQFKRPLVSRTAAQVLAMTQKLKERMDAKGKASNEVASTFNVEGVKPVTAVSTPVPKELRRLDPKILARVRERQAVKMVKTITRNPEVDKKIHMLERLPEMCRIMLSHYASERKTVLEQASVFGALKLSTKLGLSADELKMHVDLLVQVFRSRWIEQIFLQNKHFLKITDSTVGVTEIQKIVQDEIVKLR